MLTAKNTEPAHAYDLTDALTASEADGPTLVFIHGWLLSRAYWQPVIDLLSPHYRCLSYDLRGFGESALLAKKEPNHNESSAEATEEIALPSGKFLQIEASDTETGTEAIAASPEKSAQTATQTGAHTRTSTHVASPYSLAAYAKDLETLLEGLNLNSVWLVGHSLGGSIALWAAYLQPKRIKGVICVNAGGGIYIPKEFKKFRAAGQQMVKFRPEWLPTFPLLPQLFSRIMVNRPLAPHWGKQRLMDFVSAERLAAVGSLLETTTRQEVHLLPQVVSQLTQPVHFITATEDNIMPPRYVRYLASFHPQFKDREMVSELANCGHMAMVEQTEAVSDIVRTVVETAADTAVCTATGIATGTEQKPQ